MFQWGYLTRIEQPSRLSEGRKPLVYVVDTKGRAVLEEQDHELEATPITSRVSLAFLEHTLATNEVVIAIDQSAKRRSWTILKYLDDRTLKAQMKDKVTLKGEHGGRQTAAVVPDAYIRLDASRDIYNFFLEVDRGTVTGEASVWRRRDWRRKVMAYLEYYRHGLYQKRYNTADMRVLTITTGEGRMAHLKKITEEAGGKARFWFTTFERLKGGDILTDHVWSVATHDEKYALISSTSTTVFKFDGET